MKYARMIAGLVTVMLLASGTAAFSHVALAQASDDYLQGYEDGLASGRMDVASGIGYLDNCTPSAYSADYCSGFRAGYRQGYGSRL